LPGPKPGFGVPSNHGFGVVFFMLE